MKLYPPPSNPPSIPLLELPPFHPVRTRLCKDEWTPQRQVEFIGHLASTRSVAKAARAVSMGRESAYWFRTREGAEGFAAVWDMALARRGTKAGWAAFFVARDAARDALKPSRKVTLSMLNWRIETGRWRVILRKGRYRGAVQMADNDALLTLLRRKDAAEERWRWEKRARKVTVFKVPFGGPAQGGLEGTVDGSSSGAHLPRIHTRARIDCGDYSVGDTHG